MRQNDRILRYLTVRTDEDLKRAGQPLPTEAPPVEEGAEGEGGTTAAPATEVAATPTTEGAAASTTEGEADAPAAKREEALDGTRTQGLLPSPQGL
jgi:hypothetical protein